LSLTLLFNIDSALFLVDARRRAQIFSRVSRSTAIDSWLKSRKSAQLSEIERAVRNVLQNIFVAKGSTT
jgi:hypothetical protein